MLAKAQRHEYQVNRSIKSLGTTGFQLGLIQYDSDHFHTVLAPNGKTDIKFRAFKSLTSTYIVCGIKAEVCDLCDEL